MRFVIHGLGAVGGTVAAALALAGQEVVGIARGRQLAAVRAGGLKLRTPEGDRVAHFACAGAPAEVEFRADDLIVLAMKTQDTAQALADLRAAGVSEQAIFCAQNGVENERLAARLFPNVHAICVMLPAEFLTPGEVAAFGVPKHGIFDIGRYPGGIDAADEILAEALEEAGIAAFTLPDAIQSKYGKLLMNLGNIVDAAFGRGAEAAPIRARLRAEGEAVLAAAGIAWRDVGQADPRREALMRTGEVPGAARVGSSTAQSLARGTGSVETDFLNGEIALLARLHGAEAPANAWMTGLAARLAREGLAPGSVPVAAFYQALGEG